MRYYQLFAFPFLILWNYSSLLEYLIIIRATTTIINGIENILGTVKAKQHELYFSLRNAMNMQSDLGYFFRHFEKDPVIIRNAWAVVSEYMAGLSSDENFEIMRDVEQFIRRTVGGNLPLRRIEVFFAAYLERMAKKYSIPITRTYLRREFNIGKEEWSSIQKNLKDLSLLPKNNHHFLVNKSREIMTEMLEYDLISRLAYNSSSMLDDIPHKYTNLVSGDNREIKIAFIALFSCCSLDIADLVNLFTELDIKRGLVSKWDNREKRYHTMFHKLFRKGKIEKIGNKDCIVR
ncbi:MAG: hypothetical protein GPJ54_00045 [Candidatus Heimdallarchaeota archaeon]|nr:hypothetical protein [Candidatus Heimdallarchaeota archaeon]